MKFYKRFIPEQNEYGAFYMNYLNNVNGLSISEAFAKDEHEWSNFFNHLDDSKVHFSYAEGKWTIAELILHQIDTEAIFAGRALKLIRREVQPLPGFDQDDYVKNSRASKETKESLKSQWEITRHYMRSVLSNARDEDLEYIGTANGSPISARVIGLIIPGHNLHHFRIIKERYEIGI